MKYNEMFITDTLFKLQIIMNEAKQIAEQFPDSNIQKKIFEEIVKSANEAGKFYVNNKNDQNTIGIQQLLLENVYDIGKRYLEAVGHIDVGLIDVGLIHLEIIDRLLNKLNRILLKEGKTGIKIVDSDSE